MRTQIFRMFCLLLVATGVHAQSKKLTVAVAANMQYAMKAIKAGFEEKSGGVTVEIILGSSGRLTQQIQEGAPYDLFISADTKYPAELYKSKMTVDSPRIYAKGVLVLWSNTPGIKPSKDLKGLLAENVKKIAIANPKIAPYGAAAEEVLKKYALYDKVKDKLVFGESITQTNQFILSQSADIGFTAKSVVLSDEMKDKGTWVEVDPKSYSAIEQAAVILKHGTETNKDAAESFYNYLYSKAAKNILKKFGYLVN